jgi:uncharacterized protein (DUF2336 family)
VFGGLFGSKKKKSAKRLPQDISYKDAKKIAKDKNPQVRSELAEREDVTPEILYFMAEDKAPEVRRKVAANTATPHQADFILASDTDDEVRCDLALKIGRLIPGLSKKESERLQDLAFEILNILAQDQLPRVRAIIAEEIKHATNVPKPMIERLAHDVELVVAAPILEYSPLLTDSDLLEIIQAGMVDGGLSAVSRRAAVSDKVSGAIVAANDIPAVATLLANPNAQIREDTLDEIIEAAEQAEPLHEPLVSRPELSQGAIRRIAGFVSSAILEILNREHRMDDETKQTVKDAVKKRIKLEQSAPAKSSLKEQIERMAESDELTEDAITTAGEKGQRGFVAEALAFRAKIDVGTVNAMLDSRSGKVVTALTWRAKLSARGAMGLQRHVARVPTNATIHAHNGVEYALKEPEMEWFIHYFENAADNTDVTTDG